LERLELSKVFVSTGTREEDVRKVRVVGSISVCVFSVISPRSIVKLGVFVV